MVPLTEKVAWPAELVLPETVVIVLPEVVERVIDTALPEMGFPAPSRIVTVIVEAVTPSAGTEAGADSTCERSLLMACTVTVADTLAPLFALVELTVPVLSERLLWVVVPRTTTVARQLPLAGMVPPESDQEFPPADALRVPPHVLLVTAGEVFRPPLKCVSENRTPVMGALFGFVSVMVLVVVPLMANVEGEKLIPTVGAASRNTTLLLWVQAVLVCLTVTVSPTVLVAVILIGLLVLTFCV